MNNPKKKRNKKYVRKYVTAPNILALFGGMSGDHAEHLRRLNIRNHGALALLAQGDGEKKQWDDLVGAINMAIVMCEQGIGFEFHGEMIAAREALLECGKRAVRNNHRFILKGDELKALTAALDSHDAQLENVRAIDIEKAYQEVERRLRHRINSTSVMAEIRKIDEAAGQREAA